MQTAPARGGKEAPASYASLLQSRRPLYGLEFDAAREPPVSKVLAPGRCTPYTRQMAALRILDDEPTASDVLDRAQYASALADVALTCSTPNVVGVFGRWGVGKTSLLRLIEDRLSTEDVITVWFDAWRHQRDEHPALGMLHALVGNIPEAESIQNTATELVKRIGMALGSFALERYTPVDPEKLSEFAKALSNERFEIRTERIRLLETFSEVLDLASGGGRRRVVFFIDDLDRCLPDAVLGVLESIKLYMSSERCVYFIAADKGAIEASIRQRYAEINIDAVSYLDKIVQVPFTIPPISPTVRADFVGALLPSDLADCVGIIEQGLGDNPRGVKRFVNTLILTHSLASSRKFKLYEPKILATFLLIQNRSPDLYTMLARRPGLLRDLVGRSAASHSERETLLTGDASLKDVLENALEISELADENLANYVFLTSVARGPVDNQYQDASGRYTEEGIARTVELDGELNEGESVFGQLPLLDSDRQRSVLLATNERLFLVLDDERTQREEHLVQWSQPLDECLPVTARITDSKTPVVDIGVRKRWLYSRSLHANPRKLERAIQQLIEDARTSPP